MADNMTNRSNTTDSLF